MVYDVDGHQGGTHSAGPSRVPSVDADRWCAPDRGARAALTLRPAHRHVLARRGARTPAHSGTPAGAQRSRALAAHLLRAVRRGGRRRSVSRIQLLAVRGVGGARLPSLPGGRPRRRRGARALHRRSDRDREPGAGGDRAARSALAGASARVHASFSCCAITASGSSGSSASSRRCSRRTGAKPASVTWRQD